MRGALNKQETKKTSALWVGALGAPDSVGFILNLEENSSPTGKRVPKTDGIMGKLLGDVGGIVVGYQGKGER